MKYRIKKEIIGNKTTYTPQLKIKLLGIWCGLTPSAPYSYSEDDIHKVKTVDFVRGGIYYKKEISARIMIEKHINQCRKPKIKTEYIKYN